MTGEGGASSPNPRGLRIGYLISQWTSLCVFIGLSWLSPPYEKLFKELEFSSLPAPTELVIFVSSIVRSPAGTIVIILVGVGLTIASQRGIFDRRLKKLIVGNLIWIVLMAAFVPFALHSPVVQIDRALRERQR